MPAHRKAVQRRQRKIQQHRMRPEHCGVLQGVGSVVGGERLMTIALQLQGQPEPLSWSSATTRTRRGDAGMGGSGAGIPRHTAMP